MHARSHSLYATHLGCLGRHSVHLRGPGLGCGGYEPAQAPVVVSGASEGLLSISKGVLLHSRASPEVWVSAHTSA